MNEAIALIQHFPYLGLVSLVVLGVLGFPFPEDATLILCGFLSFKGTVAPLPAISLVYTAVLAADLLLYEVGRRYGRRLLFHPVVGRFLSEDRIRTFESGFRSRGALIILLGRHLVGLRAQLFIAAGMLKVRRRAFLFYDALSATLTVALFAGIGYLGGNSIDALRKDIARVEHVVLLVAIAAFVSYMLFKYVRLALKKTGSGRDESGRE